MDPTENISLRAPETREIVLRAETFPAMARHRIAHWLYLLVGEVERLAKPWHENERLARVWDRVGNDLAHPWTAEELARLAHCSPEHLRRLCLLELGRPPMQHVTSLRVQRAAELFLAGVSKLAAVVEAIGYSEAFALSKIFKK